MQRQAAVQCIVSQHFRLEYLFGEAYVACLDIDITVIAIYGLESLKSIKVKLKKFLSKF